MILLWPAAIMLVVLGVGIGSIGGMVIEEGRQSDIPLAWGCLIAGTVNGLAGVGVGVVIGGAP